MKYFALAAALLLHFSATCPAMANERTWSDAGTVGTAILVGAAIGVPLARDDWEGSGEGLLSVGAASLVATGLKRVFPEDRPDLSDRRGFPSGHAAISFAAAASIQNRYGWKAGIPAQALASLVAVSRVEARKHRWHDVAVGALIGEVSGFLLTEKENSRVKLFPWGDSKGGGFAMTARF